MARQRAFSITLTKQERKTIRKFQKKTASSNARTRCAILLAADSAKNPGKTYREIASAAGASTTTVITTLKEFLPGDNYAHQRYDTKHWLSMFIIRFNYKNE